MNNIFNATLTVEFSKDFDNCPNCEASLYFVYDKKSEDLIVSCKECEEFTKIINMHKINNDKIRLVDLLVEVNLVNSKGEAKRLIAQGAVSFGKPEVLKKDTKKYSKVKNINFEFYKYLKPEGLESIIIKVGKRRFLEYVFPIVRLVCSQKEY